MSEMRNPVFLKMDSLCDYFVEKHKPDLLKIMSGEYMVGHYSLLVK